MRLTTLSMYGFMYWPMFATDDCPAALMYGSAAVTPLVPALSPNRDCA
jgi:hypothetical protein